MNDLDPVTVTVTLTPDRTSASRLLINGRNVPVGVVTGTPEPLHLTDVHVFEQEDGGAYVILGTNRGVAGADEIAADDQTPRAERDAVLRDARRMINQALDDVFDFDFRNDDAPQPLKSQSKYKDFSFDDDDSYGDLIATDEKEA